MHARAVVPARVEGVRADRLGHDECACRLPPEGCLVPVTPAAERDRLERALGHRVRNDDVGDAELGCDRGAVTVVPVEQLQDGDGGSELARPLERGREAHGIDQPDAPIRGERVRRPRRRLVDDPGEALGASLVAEANVHPPSVDAPGGGRSLADPVAALLRAALRARAAQPPPGAPPVP